MTKNMATLTDIAESLDIKIQAYLNDRKHTHFWFADFPGNRQDRLPELSRLGFDNYPLAQIQVADSVLLFEKLIGANMHIVDGRKGSFFHTWCERIIERPSDVYTLKVDLDRNESWATYFAAVANCMNTSSEKDQALPIGPPGFYFYPLDMACNLCGTGNMLTFMMDAEDEVDFLLDVIADLYLEVRKRLLSLGIRLVNMYGFPCSRCSDLQLPAISPALIRRFILPQYERIARECGGTILDLYSSDIGLLEEVMTIDSVIGCCFDRRLPLTEIRKTIGDRLFVLHHGPYDDALGGPTWKDGMYWNNIIQCHGREIAHLYMELGEACSMAICISRPCLQDVCRVRDDLLERVRHF